MSVERPFEAWEEIHRQGQDLADRLAQGFSGLISHPPPFPWPPSSPSALKKSPFELDLPSADGVTAILDIGSRIGRVGAEFGAGINGMVQHFFRQLPLPVPFRREEKAVSAVVMKADLESRRRDEASEGRGIVGGGELGGIGGLGIQGISAVDEGSSDELIDDDGFDADLRASGRFIKPPEFVVELRRPHRFRPRDPSILFFVGLRHSLLCSSRSFEPFRSVIT